MAMFLIMLYVLAANGFTVPYLCFWFAWALLLLKASWKVAKFIGKTADDNKFNKK